MANEVFTDRVQGLDDPQLRALAPLIYVAWADDNLPDEERLALADRLKAQPWLRPAAREIALKWLDPGSPPHRLEVDQLSQLVARIAKTASPRARHTFLALARELAVSPEIEDVVEGLGRLLGAEIALPVSWEVAPIPAAVMSESDRALSLDIMGFLDGTHAAMRKTVRDFLNNPDRRAYGLSSDEMREHTRKQLEEFAATGLIEFAFPGVTCQGDLGAFMATFEELGHGDLSLAVKLGVQAGLYGGAVWALGTAKHHERLSRVASLEELGCFAMSEVGHGSNVADLETLAIYDHENRVWVIHTPAESARKEWIGGAAQDARMAAVFAQLEVAGERHGVHAFLVPIRQADGSPCEGVRTGDSGHKMGLLGVDNGRLWFEHTRIPVDHLLDRFATIDSDGKYQSPIESPSRRFFTMLGTLVGGRICVGSAAVSAARTCLAIAIRYATVRRQFAAAPSEPERALLEYPSHRKRLLPYLAESVVLRTAFEAARLRHSEHLAQTKEGAQVDARQLEAEVAILKVLGSRHGVDAAQACREACGGQGYLSVNRLADLRADVEIFTTFEGDNTVLSQLVAKALLSNYQHQFAEGGAFTVARILGRRALSRAVEKNPLAARLRDAKHLRSRDFQQAALAYREAHIVETLAARLRKRISDGMDFDRAFLEVQEHAIAAAQAFGERLAFDCFVDAEAKFARSGVKERKSGSALERLSELGDAFALHCLEKHAAWYLEDGFFETGKSRAISAQLNQVLAEIAPSARSIVDAFGIGDHCLAAPIAFFDPAHPTYI